VFVPLCFLWSKWEALTCLFLLVSATAIVEFLEDVASAEPLKSQLVAIKTELREATQRSMPVRSRNQRAKNAGIDSNEQQTQLPESPTKNLELSLTHACDHISTLKQHNKLLNTDLHAARCRIQEIGESNHHLLERLDYAHAVIRGLSHTTGQLKVGNSKHTTATSEQNKHVQPFTNIAAGGQRTDVDDAFQYLGSLVVQEAVLLPHKETGSSRAPSRRYTSDTSFEDDLEAARVEMLVKRKVLEKVDLAFEVCRGQGRFYNCREKGLGRGDEDKVRVDSLGDTLMGVEVGGQ
jgi:hypothetical protein